MRSFPRSYGMLPYISGGHMTPGEIQLYGAPPLHAWLPVGRFPEGVDEVSDKVAADLREAGFRSESDPEVMVKKRTKLLSNIGNSMVALRDPGSEDGEALIAAARAEALACYEAAGLATMDPDVLTADWEGTTKAGNDVKIPGVDTCAATPLPPIFLFAHLHNQEKLVGAGSRARRSTLSPARLATSSAPTSTARWCAPSPLPKAFDRSTNGVAFRRCLEGFTACRRRRTLRCNAPRRARPRTERRPAPPLRRRTCVAWPNCEG